jgi:hypothetical protein
VEMALKIEEEISTENLAEFIIPGAISLFPFALQIH